MRRTTEPGSHGGLRPGTEGADPTRDEWMAGEAPSTSPERCPTCGAAEMKLYCARCGERRLTSDDHSLRRFLGDAVEAFTSLDSRIWRSFATLVLRPGRLTADYLRGVRQPYYGPLRLFLVCNLLFFLLQVIAPLPIFNIPLEGVLRQFNGVLQAVPVPGEGLTFGEFMRERPEAFAEYADAFASVSGTQARTLVIVMVPIFALLLYAVHGRSRRFYTDHLVFSLHAYAFQLLLLSAITLALHCIVTLVFTVGPATLRGVSQQSLDFALTVVIFAPFTAYLAVAGRRAFGDSLLRASLKALFLATGWFLVLLVYRMILFFTTVVVL